MNRYIFRLNCLEPILFGGGHRISFENPRDKKISGRIFSRKYYSSSFLILFHQTYYSGSKFGNAMKKVRDKSTIAKLH